MFGFKFKKFKEDRRGLSLVELICALAILGIITGTVGGAMVVATNSYRQGTVESSLQQEAQFTANLIESLIVDATTSVETIPALAAGDTMTTTTQLKITNEGDNYYVINYDAASKQLTYTEYRGGAIYPDDASENQLLAEHVSGFMVDARPFAEDRNVLLSINMENGSSKYTTAYNVTSRNNPNQGTKALATAAKINVDAEIVLEPNEVYMLPVSVSGSVTDYTVGSVNNSTDNSTATKVAGGVEIAIAQNETAESITFELNTDPVVTAAMKVVTVHIRRVDSVEEKVCSSESGSVGETFTVSAADMITGKNLAITSYTTDYTPNAYIDPVKIKWEVLSDAQSYVEIEGDGYTSFNDSITIKVNSKLPEGKAAYVKATALHPNGTDSGNAGVYYNKKSSADGSTVTYGPSNPYFNYVYIDVPTTSDAGLGRGRYTIIYPWGQGVNPITKLKDLTGKNVTGLQGYSSYARYTQVGGSDKSPGYPSFYQIGETGLNGGTTYGTDGQFGAKIRVNDFKDSPHNPFYMSDYKVDMIFGLCYAYTIPGDGNTYYGWYPEDLNDIAADTTSGKQDSLPSTISIATVHSSPSTMLGVDLPAVSFEYLSITSASEQPVDFSGKTKVGQLGSEDNPVVFSKSAWLNTMFNNKYYFNVKVDGAASNSDAFSDIIKSAQVSGVDDSAFTARSAKLIVETASQQDDANALANVNEAKIRFNDGNEMKTLFDAMTIGKTYKITFGEFNGRGTENYSSTAVGSDRSAIYFKLQN